jgi:hypothetical protein
MEGRVRMRLTTIPIHQILSLAQQFCKERPSRKKKFGRPLTYPEYLILTLFALKQVYRLSYRQIPSFVRDELGNIPCLSTLHYRVKKIEQERFEEFLRWLSKKGLYERERRSFGDKRWDRFFLWLILLDWVVSWEVEEEGEGTLQGRFCFGREGR